MIKNLLKILLLFLITFSSLHAEEEELLDPREAFVLKLESIDNSTLRATWNIADGYYLYRSKFRFKSDTPGITLGSPDFPTGKVKHDEFFGDVEIYRGKITIDIPFERQESASTTVTIMAISQGCADIGVCYPPQREKREIELPSPAGKTSGTQSIIASLQENFGIGGSPDDEVLDPDVAFRFSSEVTDENTLLVRWEIAPGHYLYKSKFKFGLRDSRGVNLGEAQLPPGEKKDDEFFGLIEVYHDQVEARLPINRTDSSVSEITLTTSYQGCSEITGICYPPIKKSTVLSLPVAAASTSMVKALTEEASAAPPLSEQDSLAQSLATGNTLATILLFFGLGLLLAFTPCVFPMIPILSSIIVGHGKELTTSKAFSLSLVYVLAMALTYTVAGVIAGLFGANLQAAFQNPWILGSFSAVFVALAFSMFGFYELQLPSSWQSKLSEVSNKQHGGSMVGVAVMGLLSALIVGPCVAPPLMGALIYIGQTGDAMLGGIALFALSMGMGAPLLAIGTSAGKLLPRAGGWMDAVKAVFGVMLLAVAIWMLERILPAEIIMLMWALLAIISAIYMGAIETIKEGASGWHKLWKGLGVALLIYGIMLLIGVAAGNSDPLRPIKGIGGTASASIENKHLAFKRIKSSDDLDREIAAAKNQGKTVMLDFYADWCISCKELEKYTFTDTAVQESLANSVILQADVTANDETDQALMKRFNIIGPPAIIFYDKQGAELKNYRVVGFMPAAEFNAHVNRAFQ